MAQWVNIFTPLSDNKNRKHGCWIQDGWNRSVFYIVSAARFATAASALKVTRRGAAAAIPALSEVEEFIKAKKREEQGWSEK